jgi:phospholipid/cholesterol/gamma-HCH transport system substrate-binding protein/paraquat-inducible protein B
MGTKPNYFKIGLFIIISVILIVVAVVIWGAGLFGKEKIYYETYFDSDVTGLAVGSPVLARGVKIGQVESIDFAGTVYDIAPDKTKVTKYQRYIRVLCSMPKEEAKGRTGEITDEQRAIRTQNLINQGLRLRLASNILTGQSYLEGTFLDPNRFPVLDIAWEPKYMHVPSAPGEFSTMKDTVDKILVELEKIDVKAISENANQLLVELRQMVKSSDPNAPSANLPEVLARLDSILERIDKEAATKSPEIAKFISNMKTISDDIKELTETLKKHPSEIIFSQPPAKSEMIK